MMNHAPMIGISLALACLAASAADVPLVLDGQPKADIVVAPDTPDGAVMVAAEELQHFIREMSGATLPIVTGEDDAQSAHIVLRVNENATRPRHDGYRLRAFGGDIFIEAAQPRGALFGAYALLRELGCRWYAPGPVGTIIPKRATLTIPGDFGVIREPDFQRRYPSTGGYAETTRMGYNFTQQAGDDVLAEVRRRGLGIYRFGHLWPTLVTNQYYADGRKPTKMDFTGKEDWLPMNKEGKRVFNGQTLCFSNPDALAWFVDNAANWVIANCPHHDYLSMWSADTGSVAICHCPACQRKGYAPSDWCIMVHNKVKKRLNERGWNRRFGWIAYHGTRGRPEVVGLLDHGAGMDILYAPRERGGTREGPFTADNKRTEYYRGLFKGWMDFLREQDYQGTKTVFEYYYDLVLLGQLMAGRCLLIPQPDVMQEDIRWYRDHGFDGFFDCCPPAGAWWPDPEYKWLYAELLWDADLDLDAARADFFEHYYGPAAKPMWRARGVIETVMFEKPSLEAVARIRALNVDFDEAEGLAGGDDVLRARIKAARIHAQYCALAVESEYATRVQKDRPRAIEIEKQIGKLVDDNADFLVKNGFFANAGQLNSLKNFALNRRLHNLERLEKKG